MCAGGRFALFVNTVINVGRYLIILGMENIVQLRRQIKQWLALATMSCYATK